MFRSTYKLIQLITQPQKLKINRLLLNSLGDVAFNKIQYVCKAKQL